MGMLRLLHMFDDIGLIRSNSDETFLSWIRKIKNDQLMDNKKIKKFLQTRQINFIN